jgi:hypothetical protein
MTRKLVFTESAKTVLAGLQDNPAERARYKQVAKTLGLLETNLRHPSLQTHKFQSLRGPNGEEIFEAYAQQHTPGAYRVFFFYGPDKVTKKKRTPVLSIFAVVPHP